MIDLSMRSDFIVLLALSLVGKKECLRDTDEFDKFDAPLSQLITALEVKFPNIRSVLFSDVPLVVHENDDAIA